VGYGLDVSNSDRHIPDLAARPRRRSSGSSPGSDASRPGLEISEEAFFEALDSAEVQATLARASEIRRSDAFPPADTAERAR